MVGYLGLQERFLSSFIRNLSYGTEFLKLTDKTPVKSTEFKSTEF